jgi:hypothetical protein
LNKYISKIIFVDDDFVEEFKSKDLAGYKSFNNAPMDTRIVSLSSKDEIDELLQLNVVDAGQIKPGNVVVRSPYRSNFFIPLPDLSEDLAVRKYDIFNAFCISLGAKKVSVNHVELDEVTSLASGSINAGVSGSVPLVKGNAQLNINQKEEIKENLKKKVGVVSMAEGGKPDIEKAGEIIKRYNLEHDSLFESLLESCSLSNNRLLSKDFLIDTSKDMKKLVDFSMKARFDAIGKIYSVGAHYENSSTLFEENLFSFQLRVTVEF